jgi:hypothetical protein
MCCLFAAHLDLAVWVDLVQSSSTCKSAQATPNNGDIHLQKESRTVNEPFRRISLDPTYACTAHDLACLLVPAADDMASTAVQLCSCKATYTIAAAPFSNRRRRSTAHRLHDP